ncbi:MAG: hypothetical protein ACLFUW_08595 [Bacteroidales bacterium]
MTKKKKWNSIWLGFGFGMGWPVLVLFLFYFIKFSNHGLIDFFNILFEYNLFSKFISLCVYPNLLIFFIFIWRNLLYSARGVLMATIILALMMLIYKFLV